MQKVILILVACVFATANIAIADTKNTPVASSSSGKKIVKWVDSKGVTQYGDKLPAQEAGRNNSEMNGQGRVVKQNVMGDKKNEVADQQKIEQDRKDKILLASYTKPEEIDLARDRNLQMDQAAMQALNQQKTSNTGRTVRNNKAAEGYRARKKPVPPYLSDELRLSKLEFARIDKQLIQRKLSMEDTRKRYAEEKIRFIALKYPDGAPEVEPATSGSAPAAANPVVPPAITGTEKSALKAGITASTTKTVPAKPK